MAVAIRRRRAGESIGVEAIGAHLHWRERRRERRHYAFLVFCVGYGGLMEVGEF